MSMTMADGVVLSAQVCVAAKAAQARAVLLHGTGLHSGLYLQFGRMLAMLGVEVALLDLRGHGLSQGERGHIAYEQQYCDDLVQCLQLLAARSPLPLVVLAHSGGAALLLKTLPKLAKLTWQGLAGVALLAPTFGSEPSMVRRDISGTAHLAPMRYGLPVKATRKVEDDGRNAMEFSFASFLLARTLGIGKRRPVLRCAPALPSETEYVYSANGVAGTSIGMLESSLAYLTCPLLLATGEKDVFVNDASLHAILPWAVAPELPYHAYSFAAGDHFTVLFQAIKPVHAWIMQCVPATVVEKAA